MAYQSLEGRISENFEVSDEAIFVDWNCDFKVGINIKDKEDKLTKVLNKEFYYSP